MDTSLNSPFYVYLDSSDQPSYTTKNSNTQFTNILAQTLHLPSAQGWCVALKSLICGNTQQGKKEGPDNFGFIKVHTNLIQPLYGQEKVLAVCTREEPDYIGERLINFEPRNRNFYPLQSDLVSSIDIVLTTVTDRQLAFTLGNPTQVVLEFRRMPAKKEFTIRVNSRDDVGGTPASFGTRLPPMLSHDPTQKWNVSLTNMIFSGRFDKFPLTDDEKKISVKYFNTSYEDTLEVEQTVSVQILDTINSNKQLSVAFGIALKKFTYQTPEENQMSIKYQGRYPPPPSEGKHLFRFTIFNKDRGTYKYESKFLTHLKIPYRLAVMMGSTMQPTSEGMVVYRIQPDSLFGFEEPMKYNVWIPNFLMLYCNFIESSPIGNVLAPILKTIPIIIKTEEDEYRTYESVTDEPHRVTFSQLSNLKFLLKTVDGREAPFVGNLPTTILTLKFTKE